MSLEQLTEEQVADYVADLAIPYNEADAKMNDKQFLLMCQRADLLQMMKELKIPIGTRTSTLLHNDIIKSNMVEYINLIFFRYYC
eukprot:COSAG02_NODE_30_length_50867_cov_66.594331_19_plen_85_part_00